NTALRLANKTLQKNPDLPLAHVVAAKAYLAKGDTSQAEAQLRSALDRDPVFLPALETMLSLEAGRGKAQEVTRRLSALVAQHPRNAKLYLLLGIGYFKQNDLDSAESSVKQAIAIDQKTPDVYGVLGEISRTRGDLYQSITWYKMAIDQNPKKVE